MSSNQPIRVLIADDHPIVREGLAAMLSQREAMCVVGQATNGEEAVALFKQYQPDVTLMDVNMPRRGGLDAATHILKNFPAARVILLSWSDAEEHIYQGFTLGAKAYLLKDMPPEAIYQAVQDVYAGQYNIPSEIAAKLAQRLGRSNLTAREMEILTCLVAGMSNAEIGRNLFIAEGTVKVHVANILNKLQVSDRTQAVTAAIKRGLLQLV